MALLKEKRSFKRVREILDEYDYNPDLLIGILQSVQSEYRYLPEDVMMYVATALKISPAAVYGVATFYEQFSTSPKGRHILKVCDGTACHISGSQEVLEALREAAGIEGEQGTSKDMLFTLERVACVGACGLAPVVVVNDEETHGNLTPRKARKLIEDLRERSVDDEVTEEIPVIEKTDTDALPKHTLTSCTDFLDVVGTLQKAVQRQKNRILVCMGTPCLANGAEKIYDRLKQLAEEEDLDIDVISEKCEDNDDGGMSILKSGCIGLCQEGPLVRIDPGEIIYVNVKPEDAEDIIEETVKNGKTVDRLLFRDVNDESSVRTMDENPFYSNQEKLVLSTCGAIDAENIFEYLAFGGYTSMVNVLFNMCPEEVISEIKDSGLRGRGGAGFPTGMKWEFTAKEKADKKYVVCNGDEGDPGAFMDRCIMEGDPHRLLEGMMISGFAVGADQGYIYVRAEYPLAVNRLKKALEQARSLGLMGENILGSGFSFDIKIKEGAGAFVCGEETSLLSSIEGKRGIPRPRPPYPAQSGLWSKPTLINNVETLTNIPYIIGLGSEKFQKWGSEGNTGTKTFALAGHVARTGLVEVPFGLTLRELIFDIGGGMKDGAQFKAVQIGGPSGGCLPASELDRKLTYDSIQDAGAIIGSGGIIVMDDGTCMVEVARFFLEFIQDESCGKCVPCREGTRHMLMLLEKIAAGEAEMKDLKLLERLAYSIEDSALCGLGQTAPNPVLSSLRYFKDEYIAHINDKRCPAGQCSALGGYSVQADRCIGCAKCIKVCPHDAIEERIVTPEGDEDKKKEKKLAVINSSKCNECGVCIEECPVEAIIKR